MSAADPTGSDPSRGRSRRCLPKSPVRWAAGVEHLPARPVTFGCGHHNGHMPTMVLRVLAALLLTLLAAVTASAPVACACSCAVIETEEAMANASAIFGGTVVATSQPKGGNSAELIDYTIDVTRVYQGSVPARVIVRSAISDASCGVELTGDVTVFAQGPVEDLRTTSCSAPATIDRARLGAGNPPSPASIATPSPKPRSTAAFDTGPLFLGALAGVLALAGIAIWMVRRTRG